MSNDEHVASYKNRYASQSLNFSHGLKMKLMSFLIRQPLESLKFTAKSVITLQNGVTLQIIFTDCHDNLVFLFFQKENLMITVSVSTFHGFSKGIGPVSTARNLSSSLMNQWKVGMTTLIIKLSLPLPLCTIIEYKLK